MHQHETETEAEYLPTARTLWGRCQRVTQGYAQATIWLASGRNDVARGILLDLGQELRALSLDTQALMGRLEKRAP